MDVFTMLEQDHREVESLLDRLAESEEGPEREQMVTDVVAALTLHMRFEEESLYPTLAKADGEMAEEAENEHQLARDGLQKMQEMVSEPGFEAAVEMVKTGVSHHVEEEEDEIFDKLREELDEGAQLQLADTYQQQRREAGIEERSEPSAADLDQASKDELLERAREADIEGRSSMTKDELKDALADS